MAMKKLAKHVLVLAISILIFSSCAKNKKEYQPLIRNLAQPIWLDYETSLINLSDYINDTIAIDSVKINGETPDFYQSKRNIIFHPVQDIHPLSEMKIWSQGKSASIVLKKSKKQHYLFVFNPHGKTYKTVELAGDFNGWVPSKTPLSLNDTLWGKMLLLNKGSYSYQLVLDGEWQLNPNVSEKIDNGQGGYNSVLHVGQEKGSKPILETSSYTSNTITIKTLNKPEELFILWNNTRLEKDDYTVNNQLVTINIPSKSTSMKRSYIRVFSYNEAGMSNDLFIPLENGEIMQSADQLQRTDFRGNIIYNVFVDRFYDADKNNDWKLPDSIVLPAANYKGGDIKGVVKKIKEGYFKDLGVNTLWLSPVIRNTEGAYGYWPNPKTKFSAYHGYWPTSFNKIDRHFGTSEDLKNLTTTAHNNDENIVLDFVANHVHKQHPYYIAHPDCATKLVLPDGSLNLEKWDEHRLTTWFDKFLPTLNLEKQEIVDMLTDSVVWWANEYDLDGFRYDAAKHIPLSFWRALTKKLKKLDPKASEGKLYQLGETYGNPELISSYIGNGLLDAQFDFNVYDAALNAFAAGGNMENLAHRLQQSMSYYGAHNVMGYITGNQDRGRFISYAGGSLKFDEDPKAAGWTRKIEVGDPIGYQKLQMLMAFNMTIPGIPVIYYGDEFGMPGGNDPDCRRMMRFGEKLSSKEKENYRVTQKLTQLRRHNLALVYGDFCYFKSNENTLVYARKYFKNIVLAAFNNSNTNKTIEIDAKQFSENMNFTAIFGNNFSINAGKITIELAPMSFTILQQN